MSRIETGWQAASKDGLFLVSQAVHAPPIALVGGVEGQVGHVGGVQAGKSLSLPSADPGSRRESMPDAR